jgi:hypothetical protein
VTHSAKAMVAERLRNYVKKRKEYVITPGALKFLGDPTSPPATRSLHSNLKKLCQAYDFFLPLFTPVQADPVV